MVYGSTRPHNKTYVNQNINTTTDTTLLSPSRFTNLKNKIAHAVMSSQLFFFRLAAKGDIKRNIHRIHTTTCECVPQSLCDMLHSSNIWILSHFPPTLCCTLFAKGREKRARHDWEGQHTMKSKGHTRPPSSLEATRSYIKFISDHLPDNER